MMSRFTSLESRSRMTRNVTFRSWYTSVGAEEAAYCARMLSHSDARKLMSDWNSSSERPSATVRMMKPDFSGRRRLTISFKRWRS